MKNIQKMTEYEKYILPFYTKDILGNYIFSGTLTLVSYKKQLFFLTAGHCINDNYDYKRYGLYLITKNGEMNFSNYIQYFYRSNKLDLIIILVNLCIRDHSYIMLEAKPSEQLKKVDNFFWAGFPQKKTEKTQINKNTNIQDLFRSYYKTQPHDRHQKLRSSLNQSLGALIKFNKYEGYYIKGLHDLKNVSYYYDGFKDKGYSFKGMSGGCFFNFDNDKFSSSLEYYDICHNNPIFFINITNFNFLGIGIEHKKGKDIIGICKNAIIEEFMNIQDDIENKAYKISIIGVKI